MSANLNGRPPQGLMLSISTCKSIRSDGQPCGAPPGETGYCFWHDPERRHEMIAASRKGGSRRAMPLPESHPLTPEEARGFVASLLGALLEGAIDPTTARAAGYLLQVDRGIAAGEALEKRLAAIENLLHGK
jgi:hypothetical protein